MDMKYGAIVALVAAVVLPVAALVGSCGVIEYQRQQEAAQAFEPIAEIGGRVFSAPLAFHRHCKYIVEFPAESHLTDENASVLANLNSLSSQNIVDLVIESREVTDESIPHLKAITALDRLVVTDTSISNPGIEELAKALPSCYVGKREPQSQQ